MPKIATAAALFGTHTPAEARAWLMGMRSTQRLIAALGLRETDIGQPGDIDAAAAPAVAYVNEGRWVADCPTPGCGGAMALVRGAAGFLCGACLNVEAGYRYRPLSWPAAAVIAGVEAALEARLLPGQANWRGERVEDLEAENAAHGLAVAATERPARIDAPPPPPGLGEGRP